MATVMKLQNHQSTSVRWQCRIAMALGAALIAVGCSQGPGGQPASPVGGMTTTPSQVTVTPPVHENGDLVFSRAVVPTADGLPVEAQIIRLSDGGDVGPVLADGASYRSPPSWSPDGEAFAYAGGHGIRVWRADRDTLVAPCHPSACTGAGPPAWSPGGTTIAFAAERDGVEGLFQVSPDGGRVHPIATGISISGAPAWSPDGTSIAVITNRGGDAGVEILDAGSGRVMEQLSPSGVEIGAAVAWSPDGAAFAIEARDTDGAEGIYLMGRDGSDLRLLTACPDGACTDLSPAFSPDGRLVAFTRGRCDEPGSDCFVGDVWVMAITGVNAHALTSGDDLDCCASWGPLAR